MSRSQLIQALMMTTTALMATSTTGLMMMTTTALMAIACLNLAVPAPASAFSLIPEESPISDAEMLEIAVPLGKVNGLADEMKILSLLANLDSLLGDISELFSTDIPIDLGALGMPDTQQFEKEIAKVFEEESVEKIGFLDSLFGGRIGGKGSSTLPEVYYQDFLAALAQGTAEETTLSQDAQEKTKENLEASAQATQSSQELAEDSQKQDVSQNILRNISAQIAEQQKVDGLVYEQLQQSQLTDAVETQVIAQSLKELSENNTRSLRERVGANKQAMNQIYLFSIPGSTTSEEEE